MAVFTLTPCSLLIVRRQFLPRFPYACFYLPGNCLCYFLIEDFFFHTGSVSCKDKKISICICWNFMVSFRSFEGAKQNHKKWNIYNLLMVKTTSLLSFFHREELIVSLQETENSVRLSAGQISLSLEIYNLLNHQFQKFVRCL